MYGHSSWSTFNLYLDRGVKGFQICNSHEFDHGSVTMEEGHLTWENFVVHVVNIPLGCRLHSNVEKFFLQQGFDKVSRS